MEFFLEEEVVVIGVSWVVYVSVEQRRRVMIKMVVNLVILICRDVKKRKNEILNIVRCEDEEMMNYQLLFIENMIELINSEMLLNVNYRNF